MTPALAAAWRSRPTAVPWWWRANGLNARTGAAFAVPAGSLASRRGHGAPGGGSRWKKNGLVARSRSPPTAVPWRSPQSGTAARRRAWGFEPEYDPARDRGGDAAAPFFLVVENSKWEKQARSSRTFSVPRKRITGYRCPCPVTAMCCPVGALRCGRGWSRGRFGVCVHAQRGRLAHRQHGCRLRSATPFVSVPRCRCLPTAKLSAVERRRRSTPLRWQRAEHGGAVQRTRLERRCACFQLPKRQSATDGARTDFIKDGSCSGLRRVWRLGCAGRWAR